MNILSKEQILEIYALASGDIGEKEILQWIIEHQK